MVKERKFIILKIEGHYRHIRARGNEDHYVLFGRFRRHCSVDIELNSTIELGIIVGGKVEVWECYEPKAQGTFKAEGQLVGDCVRGLY